MTIVAEVKKGKVFTLIDERLRTIKEVADLTGVSVRTLQYYDEIGLLKPTKVNDAGYRFYDDIALGQLQQILFFKELDFPLKQIKEIMLAGDYDKVETFRKQKQLLTIKRNRLNRLLDLLDRLEKGEKDMSFQEFDMGEYIAALEDFKAQNEEQVVKHWGSVQKFEEFVQKIKDDESDVAKMAIKQYGSIEKYTEAMKYNLEHFSEIMEQVEEMQGHANEIVEKSNELYQKLTADISKDVDCPEIQAIVQEIVKQTKENSLGMDLGEGYWNMVIERYANDEVKEITDRKYGAGASTYIAKAFQHYLDNSGNA